MCIYICIYIMYMHTSMLWYIMYIWYTHKFEVKMFRKHQTNADRGAPMVETMTFPNHDRSTLWANVMLVAVWWFITLSLKVYDSVLHLRHMSHIVLSIESIRILCPPEVFWGDQIFVPSCGIQSSDYPADILAALRPDIPAIPNRVHSYLRYS